MMTIQYVPVAKTLTIMAHAAMWQGHILSRRIRFCAKYPVVGAEACSP